MCEPRDNRANFDFIHPSEVIDEFDDLQIDASYYCDYTRDIFGIIPKETMCQVNLLMIGINSLVDRTFL